MDPVLEELARGSSAVMFDPWPEDVQERDSCFHGAWDLETNPNGETVWHCPDCGAELPADD